MSTFASGRSGRSGRSGTPARHGPRHRPSRTSLFVTGDFPARRWPTLLLGTAGGLLLAYAWNAKLVDDEIGFSSADALLGHDAHGTPITGVLSGILFAFVSGLAGSFTACNIAAFGAVGPLVGQTPSRRGRLLHVARPLGWIFAGMAPVSAAYGALVGLAGTHMPQFSTAAGKGLTPRSIQSMATFGLIGLVMVVLGLAAVGLIRDPLAALSRRFPNAPLVLVGALIGGFLIGRPYPLFRDLFRHAANTHNPLYGAGAFLLQSIGNIAVMALLFLLLARGTGGRLQRRLAADPTRISILTAAAFLVAGVFTLVYWDVRMLARLGYLWFPPSPWG
ncbi:hypothetical protein [Streptomyces sp. 1331.2]|uniref:hypothetical protein n=1 Tax=Streptomyces sp. 1331.2 TaxID=1938835 RepID=UPI000BCCFBE9|nr:hypothetical protein [Streptomyces sp. 1331.2]SOB89049.1 hypothetical protein SAMN06272789_7381 [Streptomyces sp. 1331.2]